MDTLDLLLKMDIQDLPEKEYKIKRLSDLCGSPVIFKLRAIPYSRAMEISRAQMEDMEVHIMLAGVVEPNLKSPELMAKYNAATPAEMIKKMLLPGEIIDISRAIERLSGYRTDTIEEIKKK
mgnify:CR=1 FL=1